MHFHFKLQAVFAFLKFCAHLRCTLKVPYLDATKLCMRTKAKCKLIKLILYLLFAAIMNVFIAAYCK